MRKGFGVLVLCETYLTDKTTPARYNFRYFANRVMEDAKDQVPWFGLEQEFFIMNRNGTNDAWPLGWP
jgi:glutamine synthetase